MAKMYTLDKKLLIGTPEIAIGEKLYPVDNRYKTVKKVMKLFNSTKGRTEQEMNADDIDRIDEMFRLAFGDKAKEIDELDLSFAAAMELIDMTMDAMTGGDPETYEQRKSEKNEDKFRTEQGDMV